MVDQGPFLALCRILFGPSVCKDSKRFLQTKIIVNIFLSIDYASVFIKYTLIKTDRTGQDKNKRKMRTKTLWKIYACLPTQQECKTINNG